MQYIAHEPYIAPARVKPELWRLLLGIVMVVAVYALGVGIVFGGVFVVAGPANAERWMLEMIEATGPTGTLLLLATFIGMAVGPMVAVAAFHARRIRTLFGPIPRTFRHFLIAMVVCGAAYSVSFLFPNDVEIIPNLDRTIWLSFLPLALVGVLLQTGAEEILFRGYIQQQLAARFRATWVWMVLPAVLFGVLHWQPDIMGDNAIFIVAAATLFGLLAADLTAKTGSLGAAWGFHFANNTVAILVVAMDGPLSGLALFTAPLDPSSAEIRPLILLDMGTTVVTWLLIRLAVTRFP
ncbi:lysostaphin resistance A-like protein [Gymnodinialimonas hymeniacidonis]|uniref:CPBP family intramembrane glutamic endopeptidase n=1 Tax=Gymnodinialimonas hymeniacidonis TaxID=3126508 RepID=UPI0034C63F31